MDGKRMLGGLVGLLMGSGGLRAEEPKLEVVFAALEGKDAKIEAVGFFAVPVEAERRFSCTVQKRPLHEFVCRDGSARAADPVVGAQADGG